MNSNIETNANGDFTVTKDGSVIYAGRLTTSNNSPSKDELEAALQEKVLKRLDTFAKGSAKTLQAVNVHHSDASYERLLSQMVATCEQGYNEAYFDNVTSNL